MGFSCNYLNIGKGLLFDGGSRWVLYGEDFNPTDQSDYSADHCTVYSPTTNFDLSGFQPGHEVGACAFEVQLDGPNSAISGVLWCDFMRSTDGVNREVGYKVRPYGVSDEWDAQSSGRYSWGWRWVYFGVDKDEIWEGYTYYKVKWYHSGQYSYESPVFTVSNLSIDSTLHRAGYMWVEGSHLCYTDNTGDEIGQYGYGYKHKIAFDSSYSSNVGGEHAGYIRLDDNNLLQIYYVDQTGTRRRTYPSRERYGGNVNVGSSNKGYMWVGVSDATRGYGHLCFIAPNGSKRRILNGPPIGYS